MKYAIVADHISSKLSDEALRENPDNTINLDLAIKQHENYIEILKDIGLKIDFIKTDDNNPDSVFVEDPLIIIDNMFFVCNLGHPNRHNETDAVIEFLEKRNIPLNIFPDEAKIDGGDVLVKQNKVFVGISKRTNYGAYIFLKCMLPNHSVINIPVPEGLHLKSVVSNGLGNDIIIGKSACAQKIKESIEAECSGLNFIETPDDPAANILAINDCLVIREEFQESKKILEEHYKDIKIYYCNNSELSKADGALTCCSVIY